MIAELVYFKKRLFAMAFIKYQSNSRDITRAEISVSFFGDTLSVDGEEGFELKEAIRIDPYDVTVYTNHRKEYLSDKNILIIWHH